MKDLFEKFVMMPWNGQEYLWKVFWLYWVVAGSILGFILRFIMISVGGGWGTFFFLWSPFMIWGWVSLWRCAFNCEWQSWGIVVRGLIILGIGTFAVQFANWITAI